MVSWSHISVVTAVWVGCHCCWQFTVHVAPCKAMRPSRSTGFAAVGVGRIHTCPVPLPLFAGDEELPYVFVAGNQVGPLGSCCSSLVPAKSPPSPPCLNCQPPAIVAGQTVPICPPAYSTEPSHPAFLHVNLQGIPRWGPRLAGLHDAFCQAFKAASPDFQVGLAFGLGQRSGVPSGRAGLAVLNSLPCADVRLWQPACPALPGCCAPQTKHI